VLRGVRARGHHAVGSCEAVQPARLVGGIPDDKVFTSMTGAVWGGGRARWRRWKLIARPGRRRGGGRSFDGMLDGGGDALVIHDGADAVRKGAVTAATATFPHDSREVAAPWRLARTRG
jgi:hypothetical protein